MAEKPTLELIETTISDQMTVRIRIADNPHAEQAKEWVEFQVLPSDYTFGELTLSANPDRMPLSAIRLAALRRAQDVIEEKMRVLKETLGRRA